MFLKNTAYLIKEFNRKYYLPQSNYLKISTYISGIVPFIYTAPAFPAGPTSASADHKGLFPFLFV